LRNFDWPGNVRELRNTIERAVLLTPNGGVIGAEALPSALSPSATRAGPASLKEKLLEVEKQIIRDALAQSGGVVRAAARLLRTDAVTLGRKVRRHGLTSAGVRAAAS
jgi:transcriptional regulator with PAS, ATPase and Fis domain